RVEDSVAGPDDQPARDFVSETRARTEITPVDVGSAVAGHTGCADHECVTHRRIEVGHAIGDFIPRPGTQAVIAKPRVQGQARGDAVVSLEEAGKLGPSEGAGTVQSDFGAILRPAEQEVRQAAAGAGWLRQISAIDT